MQKWGFGVQSYAQQLPRAAHGGEGMNEALPLPRYFGMWQTDKAQGLASYFINAKLEYVCDWEAGNMRGKKKKKKKKN
jgi:hypothetical protein